MIDDFYFYMAVGGYPPAQSFSNGEETKFSAKAEEDKEQHNV
jgi:hypothetical protein